LKRQQLDEIRKQRLKKLRTSELLHSTDKLPM
jgi:hypothetical protein